MDPVATGISVMPTELLLDVFSKLPLKDKCACLRVCAAWRDLFSDEKSWKQTDQTHPLYASKPFSDTFKDSVRVLSNLGKNKAKKIPLMFMPLHDSSCNHLLYAFSDKGQLLEFSNAKGTRVVKVRDLKVDTIIFEHEMKDDINLMKLTETHLLVFDRQNRFIFSYD